MGAPTAAALEACGVRNTVTVPESTVAGAFQALAGSIIGKEILS